MPRFTPYAAHEIAIVSSAPCGSGLPIGLMPGALPSDHASRQTLKITAMGLLPGQRQLTSSTICSFSTVDEPLYLVEELAERGFVLQQDVIAAVQRHKSRAA